MDLSNFKNNFFQNKVSYENIFDLILHNESIFIHFSIHFVYSSHIKFNFFSKQIIMYLHIYYHILSNIIIYSHAKYLKGIIDQNHKHWILNFIAHTRLYFHIFSNINKLTFWNISEKSIFEGNINFYFTLTFYFNNSNLIELFRPFLQHRDAECWMTHAQWDVSRRKARWNWTSTRWTSRRIRRYARYMTCYILQRILY